MARYDDPEFHEEPLAYRWPAGRVEVLPPTPGAREAREGAVSVLAALDGLDSGVRAAALWETLTGPSPTLRALADAMRDDSEFPLAERVARVLHLGATLADGRRLVERLGDVTPWGEIRRALEHVIAATSDIWHGGRAP